VRGETLRYVEAPPKMLLQAFTTANLRGIERCFDVYPRVIPISWRALSANRIPAHAISWRSDT
jgi:hypothetical protein